VRIEHRSSGYPPLSRAGTRSFVSYFEGRTRFEDGKERSNDANILISRERI
jgi:hypothetical protein